MLKHMRNCEVFENRQAHSFCAQFGTELERIPQGVGVVGDFTVVQTSGETNKLEQLLGPLIGRRIEFKHDKTSTKYKSFFVEIEQTCDGWQTCRPSGHQKAIEMGCILIITSGSDCYIFDEESYFRLIACKIKTIGTKKGSNGNRMGCHTRAYIVPLKDAKRISPLIYTMPRELTNPSLC